MIVYPAIDLLDGRAVRLQKGDFRQSTVYSDEPERVIAEFAHAGATRAHLVDLSGARSPDRRQIELLSRMFAAAPGVRVQVGGGVRSLSEIERLLEAGADRVVLGSVVAEDPELALEALRLFGTERLTFAIDVRIQGGTPIAMVKGWQESSRQPFERVLAPFAERLKAPGGEGSGTGLRVLCTDVDVDGMMSGPNLALYRALRTDHPRLLLQASGGVSSLDDLHALKSAGAESAVVGKALYERAFSLQEALAAC